MSDIEDIDDLILLKLMTTEESEFKNTFDHNMYLTSNNALRNKIYKLFELLNGFENWNDLEIEKRWTIISDFKNEIIKEISKWQQETLKTIEFLLSFKK